MGLKVVGRVLAVSVAVCALLGPILGTAYWGGLSGQPELILARDIAGVPLVAYAAITVGPFGVLAGLGAAAACLLLLRSASRPQRPKEWVGVGLAAGMAAGLLIPGVVLALQAPDLGSAVFYLSVCILTGGSCGVIVGGYVSWEAGRIHVAVR